MGLPQEQPSLRPLSFRLTALNRPQYLYIPVHNPTDLPLLVGVPVCCRHCWAPGTVCCLGAWWMASSTLSHTAVPPHACPPRIPHFADTL